ncbi:hypothetical protein [Terracidiphilus gabretensis]|jgi:hypothetical protein|uniref:hypothetical protein n=1 Tax=Terracidiphilus gabretensis TaxID=1577687 RepID=UPI00071B09CB|nr:hypothetical protein [Terracidiphilus gabretensis]
MRLGIRFAFVAGLLTAPILSPSAFAATAHKQHVIALGAPKKVPYSKAGDPSGALPGEEWLKIRPLLVDDQVKEWTAGDSHDVTDRTFVVRRAVRLNDALPGDKPGAQKEHWVWQRGPWLMIDRLTGRVTALKLPDYEPGVSQVTWFRDYGAYCGLTSSGKGLYAVVAQLTARKPILVKKLDVYDADPAAHSDPACIPPDWQRDPLRITFHQVGKGDFMYEIVPGSAVLVEDSGDEPETPAAAAPSN